MPSTATRSPGLAGEFDRAVALLHSFEFGEAIRRFGNVVRADSTCAMAEWGIALSIWANPIAAGVRTAVQLRPGREAATSAARLAAAHATMRERLYVAAVLRHIPEEPLQPVPMGEVFLADDVDVAAALRMDGYLAEGSRTGIPIGVYRAGGIDSAIYVDADFLVGPDSEQAVPLDGQGLADREVAVGRDDLAVILSLARMIVSSLGSLARCVRSSSVISYSSSVIDSRSCNLARARMAELDTAMFVRTRRSERSAPRLSSAG